MKAKPGSGGGGAKPAPKKTVQSMKDTAKNLASKKANIRATGSGTPTRASSTTAPRRPRDVGTAYVAKPKNPRGNVNATRYGRKVGSKITMPGAY